MPAHSRLRFKAMTGSVGFGASADSAVHSRLPGSKYLLPCQRADDRARRCFLVNSNSPKEYVSVFSGSVGGSAAGAFARIVISKAISTVPIFSLCPLENVTALPYEIRSPSINVPLVEPVSATTSCPSLLSINDACIFETLASSTTRSFSFVRPTDRRLPVSKWSVFSTGCPLRSNRATTSAKLRLPRRVSGSGASFLNPASETSMLASLVFVRVFKSREKLDAACKIIGLNLQRNRRISVVTLVVDMVDKSG